MLNEAVKAWPAEWTEEINNCPICSSGYVGKDEDHLIDWFSHPPSGYWRICICSSCGVGYLSPRPTLNHIKEAYNNYYTHSQNKDNTINKHLRKIQQYLYKSFCDFSNSNYSFSGFLVYYLARVVFPIGLYFDAKSRHIFQSDNKGRLLDVGCGNGEFLRLANRFGWDVVGVDFDKHAVSEARTDGIDVRLGGIEVIDDNEKFDFISLSHVIEHVYDPVSVIRSCYSLLNDGGALWLETPNIDSVGHARYKSNWRGLEPPRHIMLFNQSTLSELLSSSGFVEIQQKLHGLSGLYMGLSSERLLTMSSPCATSLACALRKVARIIRVVLLEFSQLMTKKRREYLTFIAIR